MRTLWIELRKERRTGAIPALPAVGALGGLYALVNFLLRGDALLALPMDPMDVLLTQLYGMLVVLDLFGVVTAACIIWGMEFRGNAARKLYALPVSVPGVYLCKFLILTVLLLAAVGLQELALAGIGLTVLPAGTFDLGALLRFAAYAFLTSMPVLSFMLLAASRSENMWVPLGVGVAGFLSGMALASAELAAVRLHPFVLMLTPAVAMSARPDPGTAALAAAETALFLAVGLYLAKNRRYE